MNKEQAKNSGMIILYALGIAGLYLLLVMTVDLIIEEEDKLETPSINGVYQPAENHDASYFIEKVDPDAVSVISVDYFLLDASSGAVPGVQGSVKEIYGLNFEDPYTNVSFQDNDRDGKISSGDIFLIKNTNNGGQAQSGYSLLLKFSVTGDKMNGGGTKLG